LKNIFRRGTLTSDVYQFKTGGSYDKPIGNYLTFLSSNPQSKHFNDLPIGMGVNTEHRSAPQTLTKNITTVMQYINISNREVYIRDRNNNLIILDPLTNEIEPTLANVKHKIVIRTHHIVDLSVKANIYAVESVLSEHEKSPTLQEEEIVTVYKYIKGQFVTPPSINNRTVVLPYDIYIDPEEIEKDVLYLVNKDIIITSNKNVPDHPFGTIGQIEGQVQRTLEELSLGRTANVLVTEIYDAGNKINKRYTSILGLTIEIPVIKNNIKEDGFYLYYSENGERKTIYAPLDKMDEYGLYKTIEEAESGGNISSKLELEVLNAKREAERIKHESSATKDRLEIEHKQNINTIELMHKQKLDELTQEANRLKTDYENRKNNLDLEIKAKLNNMELEHKTRLSSLGEEITKSKVREQELKEKLDAASHQRKLDEIELDRQRDENKTRMEEMKKLREEFYQERQSKRDDSTNGLKFIVAAMGIVGTILILGTKK